MLQEPLSFGENLAKWMSARGYSSVALGKLTHQKSRTTISRLLHDQCSPQRCARFIDEIVASIPEISGAELSRFQQSVSVNRMGKQTFLTNATFLYLARANDPPEARSQPLSPMAEALLPWAREGPCQILCFGCLDARVLRALGEVLRESGEVTIRHYFLEERDPDMTFFLPKTLPLLRDARYELVSVRREALMQASSVAAQDAILLRSASGRSLLMVPDAEGNAQSMAFSPGDDLLRFYQGILDGDGGALRHYRKTYACASAMDYTAFLDVCLTNERNRAIWQLKPDIGTEYMPVNIVNANFQEQIEKAYPAFRDAAQSILEYYLNRYRNLYTKRQPTYLIMCKSAMISFARTGRQSDHLFCLRPYTPRERVSILENLIEQAENNPYFFPLFLKDPDWTLDYSFIGYEKLGLLICGANADYNLEKGYREIMLESPAVAAQFKDFCLNMLCREYAETGRASIEFLWSLVRMIRDA